MHIGPLRISRRSIAVAVAAAGVLSLAIGAHAALNMRALDEHYAEELREPFRTAGLCLYRDGRDSVAWHGDTIGRGSTQDTMVAIVSLGAPRSLLLRPRGGGPTLRLAGHMARNQRKALHEVPSDCRGGLSRPDGQERRALAVRRLRPRAAEI